MLSQLNSKADCDMILAKLVYKQKQYLYQITRLEYRIFISLYKLNEVNEKIEKEEANIGSINASLKVVEEGEVNEKLKTWKTKAEYKLFRLHLRKSKIDTITIVLNQSKLLEVIEANKVLEGSINKIQKQKELMNNKISISNKNPQIKPENVLFEDRKEDFETKKKFYGSFIGVKMKMAS